MIFIVQLVYLRYFIWSINPQKQHHIGSISGRAPDTPLQLCLSAQIATCPAPVVFVSSVAHWISLAKKKEKENVAFSFQRGSKRVINVHDPERIDKMSVHPKTIVFSISLRTCFNRFSSTSPVRSWKAQATKPPGVTQPLRMATRIQNIIFLIY